MKPLLYDLSRSELETRLAEWGQPAYRARQLWHAVYVEWLSDPENITTLPKALRQRLASSLSFSAITPERTLHSSDQQTRKVLFRLPDGHPLEAVLMVYDRRRTICISTQSGCGMNCSFCATGQMGFFRNLSSGEIVEQVLHFGRILHQQEDRITNIVLMGMGEPFANYDAVLEAIDRLNDHEGANFGERRFTISTVGVVPGIYRFSDEKRQVNLAVSLHAATDELRDELIPMNRRYPLEELMQACRYYVDTTHRRISFEWALINGVNDGPEQADAFLELVRGLNCHVNLIPLNPTAAFPGAPPADDAVHAFQDRLTQHGVACTLRLRRGIDIQAGCGQLAAQHQRPAPPPAP